MSAKFACVVALAVAAPPGLVSADVMTFTDLPPSETYDLGSYSEGGIVASGTDFYNFPDGTLHLDVGGVPTNNSDYVFSLSTGLFDFKSFDLVALGVPETAIGLLLAYDASNSLIRSIEFSIASSRTVTFNDLRNLSHVAILATGDIDDHFSLDNVTLAAAVPEPATWGLMITGFGLAGTAMRRGRPTARQRH